MNEKASGIKLSANPQDINRNKARNLVEVEIVGDSQKYKKSSDNAKMDCSDAC